MYLKATVAMIGLVSVTFEAAVSANEKEADFIPVSITHWFRWRSRSGGGSRVAVGRSLSGDFHLWQHCRRCTRKYKIYFALQKFKKFPIESLFFTRNSGGLSLMLSHNDEFISVDLQNVRNILLAESFEELHSLCIDSMCSLTRRAKLTVTLEIVLADVKLGAGSSKPAGAVHTVALVVMWANLEGSTEWVDSIITMTIYNSSFRNLHHFQHMRKRFSIPTCIACYYQ